MLCKTSINSTDCKNNTFLRVSEWFLCVFWELFWQNTVLDHDVWTFLPIGSSVSLCLSSTEYVFYPSHQTVILVWGAKVIPGFYEDARSSLLFSEEISTPQSFRVVFLPKNLASSNPDLFRAPETKTTDAKRKRIKKCRINKKRKFGNSTPSALRAALKNPTTTIGDFKLTALLVDIVYHNDAVLLCNQYMDVLATFSISW